MELLLILSYQSGYRFQLLEYCLHSAHSDGVETQPYPYSIKMLADLWFLSNLKLDAEHTQLALCLYNGQALLCTSSMCTHASLQQHTAHPFIYFLLAAVTQTYWPPVTSESMLCLQPVCYYNQCCVHFNNTWSLHLTLCTWYCKLLPLYSAVI